jgi:DNA-binding HxlR family transcriptional regulator
MKPMPALAALLAKAKAKRIFGTKMRSVIKRANPAGIKNIVNQQIPGATRRVLNVQLNQLEQHELISKRIYAELPPRVEYSLTEFGQSVIPVISTLGKWGDDHQERLRKVIANSSSGSPRLRESRIPD